MKAASILLATLLSLAVSVRAEVHEPQTISTEKHEELKQYVFTIHDDATSEAFDEVVKWIGDSKGEVVQSINEEMAKFIIAKMKEDINELEKSKPTAVESVEEDDLEWDDHYEL